MSLRKSRYIHVQCKTHRFNGFTVLFWPDDDRPSEVVHYSVAKCHKDDQFCKASARMACVTTEQKYECTVKEFPGKLAEIQQSLMCQKPFNKLNKKTQRFLANDYAWVWKYFL